MSAMTPLPYLTGTRVAERLGLTDPVFNVLRETGNMAALLLSNKIELREERDKKRGNIGIINGA
jgi:hypothetical protein